MDHGETPQQASSAQTVELEREVDAIYQAYSAGLLSYAVSITRQEDGALDAVQEVFLRYFVERSYGRQIESPRGWLYRVLRNYVLDHLGSAVLRREILTRDLEEAPDLTLGIEATILRAQMARQITFQFTDRELECLRLRAGGLSYEEIGGILGIRPGTVSSLLTRVHKKLRGERVQGGTSMRSETVGALYFLFAGGTNDSP